MGVLPPVEIKFSEIPGKIVAIVGKNGAGKTTLLESYAGAGYLKTPHRGNINGLAREDSTEGALIEADVYAGAAWTLRHVFGADGDGGKSLALDSEGNPVKGAGPGRKAFAAWAKGALPPANVFEAAHFMAQGDQGLVSLDPAARKAVLLRVLGVDYLEALSARAKKRAKTAELAATKARADVAAAERRVEAAGSVEAAEAAVAAATAADLVAVEAHADATAELRAFEAASAEWDRRAAAADEALQRSQAVAGEIERLEGTVGDAEKRIANNRAVLEERDAILKAEADLDALRAAERSAEEDCRAVKADHDAAARAALEALANGGSRRRRATTLRESAANRRSQAGQVRPSGPELDVDKAAADYAGAERAEEAWQAEARAIAGEQVGGLGDRVDALRRALAKVSAAQELDSARVIAGAALTEDNAAQKRTAEHPARVIGAQAEVTRAKGAREEAHRALRRAQEDRAARVRCADLEAQAAELEAEAAALDLEAETFEQARIGAKDRCVAHEAAYIARTETFNAARVATEKAQELAKRAGRVREADGRIEELTATIAVTRASIAEKQAALEVLLAKTIPESELGQRPRPGGIFEKVRVTEANAREAGMARGAAAGAVERASEAAGELDGARVASAAADLVLADWTKLAADLGRDGLQAMEIDAGIPELNERVNDLLRRCVSADWTVNVETSYASSDGKKMLEGLPIQVYDARRGVSREVREFSGGEQVILAEALALALVLMVCNRAGLSGVTLVRDESGAALDPENAAAYVAMLRRAAEIVDAAHVLVVSHSPDVQALADARIHVRPEGVEIET